MGLMAEFFIEATNARIARVIITKYRGPIKSLGFIQID